MALRPLSDEQVRTWTRKQKDECRVNNVYRMLRVTTALDPHAVAPVATQVRQQLAAPFGAAQLATG